MSDNINLNLLGARVEELLIFTRRFEQEVREQFQAVHKRLNHIDVRLEGVEDETRIVSALLRRLEHRLARQEDRLTDLEARPS